MSCMRRLLVLAAVLVSLGTPTAVSAAPWIAPSATPAFAGDGPDPDVVYSNGTYYAFTTGTTLGNHLQVLESSAPTKGYGSSTGVSYGSTALETPPSWEQVNTQTSPGVFRYDNKWIMFYDASAAPFAGFSGHSCLSVATTVTLPKFTDASTGPLYCGPPNSGSVLDPSPYVDPATGLAYLTWKTNDGSSLAPSQVWAVQLSATGTAFAGTPVRLLTVDQPLLGWETTFDDPQMVPNGGAFDLLFSAGANVNPYASSAYSMAETTCTGPLGPCVQPTLNPFLTSYANVSGPGGGAYFADALGEGYLAYANCYCGSIRKLYVAPFSMGAIRSNVPSGAVVATPDGKGYWVLGRYGGVSPFGDATWLGGKGGQGSNHVYVAMSATADGKGYWIVNSHGGVANYGDASWWGGLASANLTSPVVGFAATGDGTGYWMVTASGQVTAYGSATTEPLGVPGPLSYAPVVAMARTSDSRGYWLLSADGTVTPYGDATSYGSVAGNFVGITPTPDGNGYWLLAANGGVSNLGDAVWSGSMKGRLGESVAVGLAAAPSGYWIATNSGRISNLGGAYWYGGLG